MLLRAPAGTLFHAQLRGDGLFVTSAELDWKIVPLPIEESAGWRVVALAGTELAEMRAAGFDVHQATAALLVKVAP